MNRLATVSMESALREQGSFNAAMSQVEVMDLVGMPRPGKKSPDPTVGGIRGALLSALWQLHLFNVEGEDDSVKVGQLMAVWEVVNCEDGSNWICKWKEWETRDVVWSPSDLSPVQAVISVLESAATQSSLLHDAACMSQSLGAMLHDLTDMPLFMSEETVGLEWRELAHEALDACDDLADVCGMMFSDLKRVRVIWRTKPATSSGMIVLGKARKARREETDLWPGEKELAPSAVLELSLPGWLALNREGRIHLMGHELLHLVWETGEDGKRKVKTRPHEIEAFASELETWGPSGPVQARGVLGAAAHKGMERAVERAQLDDRQVQLFAAIRADVAEEEE